MTDDDMDFIDELVAEAEESDNGQMFECPGEPGENCGSHRFGVSLLARVGPKDAIGIYCAECGWPVIDAYANDTADGIEDQIREMQGVDE